MSATPPALADWVGRQQTMHDLVDPTRVAQLAATLDVDIDTAAGTPLPPLWHWMYFAAAVRPGEIGDDGHPRRGGFLPPVPLPRRMWAGGRLAFHAPLTVGDTITRRSTIAGIHEREGRSGALVFVTVRHEIGTPRGPALTEEHDIVYREAPRPDAPPPEPTAAPADAAFSREVVPDPVLLFRYSALTFNGHRIHYDRSYVTGVEGYPGLIVHGPLIATLLAELARAQRPRLEATAFEFRALHPVFDIHRFAVCGRPDGDGRLALWARDHAGRLAMQARLTHRV